MTRNIYRRREGRPLLYLLGDKEAVGEQGSGETNIDIIEAFHLSEYSWSAFGLWPGSSKLSHRPDSMSRVTQPAANTGEERHRARARSAATGF